MGGIVLVSAGDGAELGKTTEAGTELSELKVCGVEASKKMDRSSAFVSSEHIVQFDNMRSSYRHRASVLPYILAL